MRLHPLYALFFVVPSIAGCNSTPLGSTGSLCGQRDGIRVCAQTLRARPGAALTFTISNRSSRTVFEDVCSSLLVGRTNTQEPFEFRYDPRRGCGLDATQDDVIANLREMAPGVSVQETFRLPTFAFQGEYQLQVWFFDAEGQMLSEQPFTSGIFEVFPSAD